MKIKARTKLYTPCLSITEFDDYAEGRGLRDESLDHVRECKSCKDVVREIDEPSDLVMLLVELVAGKVITT